MTISEHNKADILSLQMTDQSSRSGKKRSNNTFRQPSDSVPSLMGSWTGAGRRFQTCKTNFEPKIFQRYLRKP